MCEQGATLDSRSLRPFPDDQAPHEAIKGLSCQTRLMELMCLCSSSWPFGFFQVLVAYGVGRRPRAECCGQSRITPEVPVHWEARSRERLHCQIRGPHASNLLVVL